MNIVQFPQTQIPTWQLLIEFYKFVNEAASNDGDWIDALIVALQLIKNCENSFKFKRRRIIFFYDFNDVLVNYDMFDSITDNIVKEEVDLVVVSQNIKYIDNLGNDEPQAIFEKGHKKKYQAENEKYALRLVSHCNAKLCNFVEALRTTLKVENKSPWCWNTKLTIGSKIKINISGIIAIKDESNIKLKKCWGAPEDLVSRELKYYVHGRETDPADIDMVTGYMLGATPIAYDDDALRDECSNYEAGLKFLGFTKRSSIPNEYHCGDSFYHIVHQKGKLSSARKLDALVKVLLKTNMTMLCWKIYSVKFNNPKIVMLIPNPITADRPASLAMMELAYHAQHHFWDFPTLCTQKTECTKEQFEAIDDLIDSMDLTISDENAFTPRDMKPKDYLPFDMLPHIYEQNIMDVLERKILSSASEDDQIFEEMLNDKNFVEIFWKTPEAIEKSAKNAAKKVKELFPLEKSDLNLEKAKEKAACMILHGNPLLAGGLQPISLDFDSVRLDTPAEDFEKLINHTILPLTSKTLRHNKLQVYSAQIQDIILNLIKRDALSNATKIISALRVYRKISCQFNTIADFNKWVYEMRKIVVERKLYKFWNQYVKEEQLGYIIIGEISLEEAVKLEEFYNVDIDAETQEVTQSSVNVLLE